MPGRLQHKVLHDPAGFLLLDGTANSAKVALITGAGSYALYSFHPSRVRAFYTYR